MKKKNPTKHDLRRRIGAVENALIELIERIGKYKQPKRKSS